MKTVLIHNSTLKLKVASNFVERAIGLLTTKSLRPGEGLLIEPCSSVHSFFMRFAIDVVFLSKHGDVLKVKTLAPWRLTGCFRGSAVIELASGEASRLGIEKGLKMCLK